MHPIYTDCVQYSVSTVMHNFCKKSSSRANSVLIDAGAPVCHVRYWAPYNRHPVWTLPKVIFLICTAAYLIETSKTFCPMAYYLIGRQVGWYPGRVLSAWSLNPNAFINSNLKQVFYIVYNKCLILYMQKVGCMCVQTFFKIKLLLFYFQ